MEWQTMETAPKDGTEILLFDPYATPQYYAGYYNGGKHGNYWAYSEQLVMDVEGEANPTHWCKLNPPKMDK